MSTRAHRPPGSSTGTAASDALATEISRTRRRAGLSGRGLAARSRVPPSTLAAAEHGRDIGLETLSQLAAEVPEFDAAAALGRNGTLRPASEAEWRFFADALGFTAEQVEIEAQIESDLTYRLDLAVDGVRTTTGSLADAARRTAILGAVVIGSPTVLEQLNPDAGVTAGRTHRIEDGDVSHVVELPRELDRLGMSYRRSGQRSPTPADGDALDRSQHARPFTRGASIWLGYCVRRLTFRLRFDPLARPHKVSAWTWPPWMGVDPWQPVNRWPALYPGTPTEVSVSASGLVEMVVEHPVPWACYGLCWDDLVPTTERAATSPLVVRPTRPRSFSRSLVRARRAAGLSRRALARKLEVSPATIIELEQGRAPRLSTTARLLDALPDLSPWEFIPSYPRGRRLHDEQVWETQRAYFGYESAAEIREVTIEANGDAELQAHTVGLSWDCFARRNLRIRLGATPLPDDDIKDLRAVEIHEDRAGVDARIKRLDGQPYHELVFEPENSERRVSFTRQVQFPRMFALSVERLMTDPMTIAECWRAARPTGDGHAIATESIWFELQIPTRSLGVRIQLPPDYVVDEPLAKVWPLCVYGVESLGDLRPRVHPEGFRFSVEDGRLLKLDVDRPLIGLRYVVTWLIAGGRDFPVAELIAEVKRRSAGATAR